MNARHSSRRDFLAACAAAAVAGAAVPFARAGAPSSKRIPLAVEEQALQRIDLIQAPTQVQVRAGLKTNVWRYVGAVRAGSVGLQTVPGSYLGPTIRARQGDLMRIRLYNQIGEESITHWHGLDVPADMDGHPEHVVAHNQTYDYEFPILNRAGTYWYHPHPDMRTGQQVLNGLAGFFIVHDDEEDQLPLPRGPQDVPLCIQDRSFDAANQFTYAFNMMAGFLGTTLLVNGRPDYVLSVATRAYRLRLLNGSNSRIYKLAFNDGTPLVVIGTDGGLIDAPREYPYVILSPGERVDLWADFRGRPVGHQATLQSLAFSGAGGAQGGLLNVMRVSVDRAEAETLALPQTLTPVRRYRLQDAVNAANPKTYPINFQMGSGFTLNGAPFNMTVVAVNERATCGTLELIQITNTTGMQVVAHPVHFHGRQFQILDRAVTAGGLANWETVRQGYVDVGWKDTFLMMPGETVRLLVRHSAYAGKFLYHCHNLVHEDMGMMRNFQLLA